MSPKESMHLISCFILTLCLNFDNFLILDANKNALWDQANNS